jgi:hypothetical protein
MAFRGFVAFALANAVAGPIPRLHTGRLSPIPIKHQVILQTLPQQQALEKIEDIPVIQNIFETK